MNSNRLMYILIGIITVAVFITVVLVLRNVGGSAGGSARVGTDAWVSPLSVIA